MPKKTLDLTQEDILEVMKQDILIGADSKTGKRFVYNPQRNEFIIYKHGNIVKMGSDMDSLLNDYNDIVD